MDLKNEQWTRLKHVIPSPNRKNDGRGRPRRDPRDVLNGILWILRTGAPWRDLPQWYPPAGGGLCSKAASAAFCRARPGQFWLLSSRFWTTLSGLPLELVHEGHSKLLLDQPIAGVAVAYTQKILYAPPIYYRVFTRMVHLARSRGHVFFAR